MRIIKQPPANQRRLNKAIKDAGLRHRNWYAMVVSLEKAGRTQAQIVAEFKAIGVEISTGTLSKWIGVHEKYNQRVKQRQAA